MDRNSVGILAFIASAIVSSFVALVWAHASVAAWVLTRTDLVRSPGGSSPLVASLVLLAVGGIGAVIGASLLLVLARSWTSASVRAAEAEG